MCCRSQGQSLFGFVFVIVGENAIGIAFWVIELTAPQHPEKEPKAHQPKKQAGRDQNAENVHLSSHFKRNALRDTVIEDIDIAKAAISGEHNPATAKGTASTL